MFLPYLACLSTLCTHDELTPAELHMQNELMARLVDVEDWKNCTYDMLRAMRLIHKDDRDKNIEACEWAGVRCEKGAMRSITMINSKPGAARLRSERRIPRLWLEYVPPTTENIRFACMDIPSEFNGRRLPRGLKTVHLSENHLEGRITMRDLPESLEVIEITTNRLDGTLVLTQMPPGLQRIDFSTNFFQTVIVDNSALPGSLVLASFFDMRRNDFSLIPVENKSLYPRVDSRIKAGQKRRI